MDIDHSVNTTAIHSAILPTSGVDIPGSTGSHSSSAMIAVICATVLILPMNATAMLFVWPSCAIHSRNAEMAISRPMMMMASQASARPSWTSRMSAAATISLSATGSRKAPKALVSPQRRASQPSSQSVIAATANTVIAVQFFAAGPSQASGR